MKSVISAIQPKRPTGKRWKQLPYQGITGYPTRMFFHKPTKMTVISAVEVASDAPGLEPVCTYHISITKNGRKRCTSDEAQFVLRRFNLEEALEDNHVPYGIARNFWQPVNESLVGKVCPCQDKEPAIVEDKGSYIWRG